MKTESAGPWEVTKEGKRIRPLGFAGQFQLQYYGVVGDELMLVRREDERGKIVLNNYANWTAPEIGMRYPVGSAEELQKILKDGPLNERLALLAWISGRHISSTKPRKEHVNQEPLKSSVAYESLRKSAGFGAVITELHDSEHPWVRDYAARMPTVN